MGFTSIFFMLFMCIIILLYRVVPITSKWFILLIASLVFYATWGIEKIPFMVISVLVAWGVGLLIQKKQDECNELIQGKSNEDVKAIRLKTKNETRVLLIIGIILLLAMLIIVKMRTIIEQAFNGTIIIIVPLGISYYTFSLIGYIADVYWKKEKAEKNFLKLLLFAIYFPKIIQGPISKYRNLGPQLVEGHKIEYKNLCYGIQLMLWGYFKKLVIADRLAIFVNTVYGNYSDKSGAMLLVATVLGAFQLYCDFSGYMDIACGFSEVLGIKLEKNFNHPFFSETASEFWRRWHMTLGIWFKDYIYMPITVAPWMMKLMQKCKNRFGMSFAKSINIIISLSAVWILTGLWHGTGANYVAWGVYWAILIIMEMLLTPHAQKLADRLHIDIKSTEWHLFRRFRTFFLFLVSRVLSIPSDIDVSFEVYRKILFEFKPWELVDGTVYLQGVNKNNFIVAIIGMIILFQLSKYEEAGNSGRDFLANRSIVVRWPLLYCLIFSTMIFGIYGAGYDASSFAYMRF